MMKFIPLLVVFGLSSQGALPPREITALRTTLPETRFVTSKDGTRIAFDVTGSGPTVMLLHGGGMNRRSWHTAGYVGRLAKEFRVVTVDLRGNGDSDKPVDVARFAFERINEDLTAVAEAIKADRFSIWGFSYGANVGRYFASRTDRVTSMVYIGIPFGKAIDDVFMRYVEKMPTRPPFISAMLTYPPVEPADMKCPTLWIVGTRNEGAFKSVEQYRGALAGTPVTLQVVDGLDHPQEFDQIDRVFEIERNFTKQHAR
jgi:pimeloyl-ACP methyl ester carboxylesterase